MHAVLATRRDLRLRLQQLRLAGELAEIRAADLRFTERETRELLQASDIELSEAGVMLLHQRTEGWAAGLRLAALSLARPQIASELSLSVHTVNTHIRSIYAKLGASDRSSAVQRARELRLLSAGRTR